MATGATYSVDFRRKREQRTDYKRRLNLLKSGITRFVVRTSNRHVVAQLVAYSEDGDKVVAAANSAELAEYGWKHATSNTPAAYLTGLLCGVRGRKANVESAILDTGLYPVTKGSRIYATLKGLKDAKVVSEADASVFPSEDRLTGKVIASYREGSKGMEADFSKVKEAVLKSK